MVVKNPNSSGIVTPAQLRAARGLLNISIVEMAKMTGLGVNTIRRAEDESSDTTITASNLRVLMTAFNDEGVVFVDADVLGPGVRLREIAPRQKKPRRRDLRSGEANPLI